MIDGRAYVIDFLHSLAGLHARAVVGRAVELTVDGPRGPIDAKVLHPMDVLRARIAAATVLRRRAPGSRASTSPSSWRPATRRISCRR